MSSDVYVLAVQLVRDRLMVSLISHDNQRIGINEPVVFPLVLLPPEGGISLPNSVGYNPYQMNGQSVWVLSFSSALERQVWATHYRQEGVLLTASIDPVMWWRMTHLPHSFTQYDRDDGGLARVATPAFPLDFRVMSLDVEASGSAEELYSVAIHGYDSWGEYRHVFMMGSGDPSPHIMYFQTEAALLKQLCHLINARDPDVLLGWHIREFDIRYLVKKCRQHGFECPIGRFGGSDVYLPTEKALPIIPGRLILDGAVCLNRLGVGLEGQSLDVVAHQLLGQGKTLTSGMDKIKEIERMFREDKVALGRYNLLDSELVSQIFESQQLLPRLVAATSVWGGTIWDAMGDGLLIAPHIGGSRLSLGELPFGLGEAPPRVSPPPTSVQLGRTQHLVMLNWPCVLTQLCRSFDLNPLHDAPDQLSWVPDHTVFRDQLECALSEPALLESELRFLVYHPKSPVRTLAFPTRLLAAWSACGEWVAAWVRQQGGRMVCTTESCMAFCLPDADGWSSHAFEAALQEWAQRLPGHTPFELQIDPLAPYAYVCRDGQRGIWVGVVDGEAVSYRSLGDPIQFNLPIVRRFLDTLLRADANGESISATASRFIETLYTGTWDGELVYTHRVRGLHYRKGTVPPYVIAARKIRQHSGTIHYVYTMDGPTPVTMRLPEHPLDYHHYVQTELSPMVALWPS
ncbi:hypothetical protein EBZ35_05420 [bacterium]|nr:hypothetical protein [bacterium]